MPFHGFARKHFPFRWSLPFQMLPASILKRRRLAFGLGVRVCTNDAPFFLIPHTNRRRVRWLRGASNVPPRLIPFLRVACACTKTHLSCAARKHGFCIAPHSPKATPGSLSRQHLLCPGPRPSKNKTGASEAFACVRAGLSGTKNVPPWLKSSERASTPAFVPLSGAVAQESSASAARFDRPASSR